MVIVRKPQSNTTWSQCLPRVLCMLAFRLGISGQKFIRSFDLDKKAEESMPKINAIRKLCEPFSHLDGQKFWLPTSL